MEIKSVRRSPSYPWPRYRISLIVASCCVLLLVAIGFGLSQSLWRDTVPAEVQSDPRPQPRPEPQPQPTRESGQPAGALPVPVPVVNPTGQPVDISTIRQAMANCDAVAARDPEGLHFLVIPVVPATLDAATPLLPVGEDYRSFALIQSQDLLAGLEGGSLALAATPYRFSVMDAKWANTQTWNEAKGPSKFVHPNGATVSNFRIGFAPGDKSVRWTSMYDRQRGACYWVNVHLPGQPYALQPGRLNFGKPKSFPSPAATMRCVNRACEIDTDGVD